MYPHRQPPDSPRHAVLTTIASDSHTWNLLFLQLLLEEQGWEVTNLGACVPVDVLIEEATARPPGLIVVSTVNGHGAEEAPGLARAVRAVPTLARVPLVVGGKLDTSGTIAPDVHASLTDAGFDAVLTGANAVPGLLALLEALPEHRHGKSHADAVR
ncbi:cobalamin-dependent protein [Streptomyces sp. NBC_00053]|uniref:cobalamin B12-binding domain-containing protein n=1 Tax=unclassified Streptomyces TaxID=2593676 RepID=UPI000F5BDE9A|nr:MULTISPECIES: cobalamin-dependent protein [unclassified Streptomyces]WSG55184.1 cobalamin-dependent protein [Streptomyces sp. NBC_01732]WSX05897.1 cobalamin-dependent protein [Streptomyces sp. NBC_00987]MCX4391838.1 cobalamin-dependent protein [Streptomyces sp. NBC_01767]MCX5103963.1 cobalamin-dependent protein [Streptomyces sp. NBC_00439]MCX5164988.1 cobalamin-dependent protein [Streptomyces sp. NBC_00305]